METTTVPKVMGLRNLIEVGRENYERKNYSSKGYGSITIATTDVKKDKERIQSIETQRKKLICSSYTQLLQEYNENISDEDEGYDNNIATGNSMRGTPNSYKELRKQLQ